MLTAAAAPVVPGRTIRIDGERIETVRPTPPGRAEPMLALPTLVNAHDHARPIKMSSFGTFGKPLEMWIHYLALVPAVDPYLASTVFLARSALGGAGVVMVHYTRVQGLTDLPTEVMHVARDVGVRVGFAPVVFAKILPSTSIAVSSDLIGMTQPSAPLRRGFSCVP